MERWSCLRRLFRYYLVERQYHSVDPENRLVALELERRWERPLQKQQQLQQAYAEFEATSPPDGIPPQLSDQFQQFSTRGGLTNSWSLPVVAETWDCFLSDINGQHVRTEHIYVALDAAKSGPAEKGCVGGGTGMVCHSFKWIACRKLCCATTGWLLLGSNQT